MMIMIMINHNTNNGSEGGDDTVGNPRRAQISRFELFELVLLLNLYRPFSIERFEPTVFQSTVSSPPHTGVPGPRPDDRARGSLTYMLLIV